MNEGEAGSPTGKAPETAVRTDAARILDACRDISGRRLAEIHQQIFHAVDDNLFDLSDRCSTDEDRNLILDGVRLIRLQKEAIDARFREGFQRHCAAACQPARRESPEVAEADLCEDDLSLVNESQLEEELAIDNLIAKIHDYFHDELFGLEQRFAQLLPSAAVNNESIPFGPEALCHAFQEAYQPLELDIRIKLYVYKILDRVLMEQLGQLYHALNQQLIDCGILPRLRIRVKKSAAGRRPPQPAGEGEGAAAPPGAVPIQAQMFQALQYLLNTQFNPEATGETEAYCPPVTPLLVDTLSDLQVGLSQLPQMATEGTVNLKEQVHRHLGDRSGGGGEAHINQIDDETIDVISMIFDYILDDKALPSFIKALIARLQIPILKVAIIDREFFSRKSHPARQLLNELAYAGVGWVEESDAAKDRLYGKMESIVMRVLHEFDSDIGIFDSLLEEFRAFVEEEKRNFATAQEQIRREAEHREQVQREIGALVAERVLISGVPEDVRDFLLTTWRQVLVRITLEEGEDSPLRQRALQAMDDLVWSLSAEAGGEGRRKLMLILPLMLDALREGMQLLACEESEIEAVMDMLGRHHLQRLHPEHHDLPPTSTPAAGDDIDRMISEMNADIEALPDLDDEEIELLDEEDRRPGTEGSFDRLLEEMGVAQETDSGPRLEDEYTELVRKMELGAWVELERDGSRSRVKLAWKGDEFTSYSFMNRQYKVVAELPLYTLAEEFRQGRATVIDDVALFDRALDGVISGIMKFTR